MNKLIPIRKSRVCIKTALFASSLFLYPYIQAMAVPVDAGYFQEQNRKLTVTGTVTDNNGAPLAGASITEKGSQNGVYSDGKGQFSITVSEKAVLVISSVGFEPRELPVPENNVALTIQLAQSAASLGEVVVIGYGEQKKETVVGAVSALKGKDLLKTGGVNSVSEALQGQLPGITAVNTNGKPGSDAADIFIRGRSSWTNSAPFTLVDGVERDINQVDPNEIETISVLKDASATAVYGVRGANGVILITTKRGKLSKPVFNFTSNLGLKQPTVNQRFSDYVTAQEMYNEAAANSQQWENQIPASTIEAWRRNIGNAGPDNQYFPQINWWDELIAPVGIQQNYNLNASGGSSFTKYFVSLGYLNDGDIFKTSSNPDFDPAFRFERYNWRSNFDFNITKSTLFSVNFSGNFRYRNQPGYRIDGGGESGYGQDQFFSRMFEAPRNVFPLRYDDGFYGDSPSGEHNMVMNLNEGGQRIYKYYEGFYDAILDQKLDMVTKGLVFKARISYTSRSNYESSILRDGVGGGFANINVIRFSRNFDLANPVNNPDGTVSYPLLNEIRYPNDLTQVGPVIANYDNIYDYNRRLYYEASLRYQRRFGEHEVSGLALMNRQSNVNGGSGNVIPFPSYRQDFVVRGTYGFARKYLLEANASYSGTEKFAPGKRYGVFPSFSAGWVLSEEAFIRNLLGDNNFLDQFKVRYSWGEVGSDLGAARFNYIQLYTSGGNVAFGDQTRNVFGPRYREGAIANPDATWETSIKQNLGIDFRIFGKWQGAIDFFKEQRSGILMPLTTQVAWLGSDIYPANIGRTSNRGMEVELTYTDRVSENFDYFVRAGLSKSSNRILFRDDPRSRLDYLKEAGKPIGWQSRYLVAGYYGSIDDIFNFASPSLGVARNQIVPGDLMFVDYNADGQTDVQDQVAMKESTIPLTTASLTLGFNAGNWSVNMLWYGVSDVSREMPGLFLWDFNNGFVNAQPDVTGRWTPATADIATKPALRLSGAAHSQSRSTYTYLDASYIRLKNAEVAYQVRAEALKKIGVTNMQVYTNGSNLLTFSSLDERVDPETSGTNVYPVVRRYNVGLRLSF